MKNAIEIKRKEFSLKKITLKKDKSCQVEFLAAGQKDGGYYVNDMKVKPDYMASQRLLDAIDALRDQLCRVTNKQKDKHHKVNVTQLILSGSDDTEAYKIVGTELSDTDQKMKVETHKIHYSEESYGNEDEMREICKAVEDLSYEYIFNQEKAQKTLPLESDEEEESEEE